MPDNLTDLAEVILYKFTTSKRGNEYTGKIFSVDELLIIFEDHGKDNLMQAVGELIELGLLRYYEDDKDILCLTPKGEMHASRKPSVAPNPSSLGSTYSPNELEDSILKFFDEEVRRRQSRKETPKGLILDFCRSHTDVAQHDVEEAVEILIGQRYLDKKTESYRFDPKISNKYSKDRVRTIKTDYISLSSKALLYLRNRNAKTVTVGAFDQATPYAARRKIESIFEAANKGILIGDNYIGRGTLDFLQVAKAPIKILTSSQKEKNFEAALSDFQKQYPSSIEIKEKDGVLHGRYIVADSKYYVLDHSIKDFGSKLSTITEITDAPVQAAIKKLFDDNWK